MSRPSRWLPRSVRRAIDSAAGAFRGTLRWIDGVAHLLRRTIDTLPRPFGGTLPLAGGETAEQQGG